MLASYREISYPTTTMSEETPTPDPSAPQTPPPVEPAATSTPTYPKEQTDKKLIAGILGILLGTFGVHKFYLGYTTPAIIMLVVGLGGFFLCGIPSMVVWVIGIIEGVLYLTKTDDEFVSTYVVGKKPWF